MEMPAAPIYDAPRLYDGIVPPGPCEAFYKEVARRTGGPILELACGTGRLTIPLALAGHQVTGLDLSRPMLDAAQAKAARQGAEISFVEGEMARFELGRRFGLVIVSCNSLAHLTSDAAVESCLACIAGHLAPGGMLAFDLVNPRPAELVPGGAVPERIEGAAVKACRELIFYDPIAQIQHLRWRVEEAGSQRVVAGMKLRTFFPREVEPRLRLAGFTVREVHGDFDGNPLVASSLNQIYVASKSG